MGSLLEKLNIDEIFRRISIKIQFTKIIVVSIKCTGIIIFITVGSELLGLKIISE